MKGANDVLMYGADPNVSEEAKEHAREVLEEKGAI